MDVPTTVTTALEDRPIDGSICLEAGAGVGNTTAGLLAAGAARVYAVTNDEEHARIVQNRLGHDDRVAVLEADLRETPLATNSVEVITAHGLCNVLSPPALEVVATELTRVAAPGCHLVVDDYEPLPDDAAVRELFALENAITSLSTGHPALTFYPAPMIRRLFVGHGWEFDRERTLLDPVPWTQSHLEAHAAVARSGAAELSDELRTPLLAEVDRLVRTISEGESGSEAGDGGGESDRDSENESESGSEGENESEKGESVGEMYSIGMQFPN